MADDIQDSQETPANLNTVTTDAIKAKEAADLKAKAEEQRAQILIKDFEQKMHDEGIKIAIAVIIDQKLSSPVIYTIGDTYSITRLLVSIARYYKDKLMKELEV